MPSLKTIRKRITSVKSTQKITRAMKMVAGARLNRAQQRIVALRPYAVKAGEVVRNVAAEMATEQDGAEAGDSRSAQMLLSRRPEKNVLFLVLSSDRGLCGAFNANVSKASEREWRRRKEEGNDLIFATIGKKAREYLARRGATITQDFQRVYEGLDIHSVKPISRNLVSRFSKGEVDAIYIVYNEFKSAITQKCVIEPLLPLPAPPPQEPNVQRARYLYEPDQTALLERLVPMYLDVTILRALLESQASELGARMTAMDAATRNAKDAIARLTLVYNRARQAAITKELMEIIGGAEALKE